jgi:hypothetical protein
MANRAHVLDIICKLMAKAKNSATRDERFTLLENVQILAVILEDVTQYEKSLITDLDID